MSNLFLIFDIDGVIVDSEQLHFDVLCDLASEWTRGVTAESLIGLSLEETLDFIGIPKEKQASISDTVVETYKTKLSPDYLRPGIKEIFARLQEKGIRFGFVSTAPRDLCLANLSLLNLEKQPLLIGGDDSVRTKPYPDPYLTMLAMLDADPNNTVVIEDTDLGILAARDAGIATIYAWPHALSKQQNYEKATAVIQTLEDVTELDLPCFKEHKRKIDASRSIFFIAGFTLASWAPLIPLIKARLAVTNGTMSLLLLLFGIGSLCMMPLSGMLTARTGCRRVFTVALFVALLTLLSVTLTTNIYAIGGLLFSFGASIGAMDVVANIHAVNVEKTVKKPIMSGLHALFSLGGIMGAGALTGLLIVGVAPEYCILLVVLLMMLLMISAFSHVSDTPTRSGKSFFALPRGKVILLGLLCCIAYIMEGSMLDWSGILFSSYYDVHISQAGLAYTLFALAMTSGRFFGDTLIARWGAKSVFISSALMAFCGFALLIVATHLLLAMVAVLAIGFGLSNIAPMIFTASGQQKQMDDSLAVSAVSTMGYSGILLGPALIGGMAQVFSLLIAFLGIAVISTLLIFFSSRVTSN